MSRDINKLDHFFEKFRSFHYSKGEVIIRSQDVPSGIYYLKEGYVRECTTSKEGNILTLVIYKPQDFFPIKWAFSKNQKYNTYTFDALTSVTLRRCSRGMFTDFLEENPDILYDVMTRTAVRFYGLLERVGFLVEGTAYQKVASIVYILGERFGKKEQNKIVVSVPLTHMDIASLVGLTRETTSLELKKIHDKGIIESRKRFLVICDLKKLREESLYS